MPPDVPQLEMPAPGFSRASVGIANCLHVAGRPVIFDRMTEITRILHAMEDGDEHAAGQLLPLGYDELRKLAAHHMAHEKPGQTLDATALVHEAYLCLVGGGVNKQWEWAGTNSHEISPV
jgi:ECF sigma factor